MFYLFVCLFIFSECVSLCVYHIMDVHLQNLISVCPLGLHSLVCGM